MGKARGIKLYYEGAMTVFKTRTLIRPHDHPQHGWTQISESTDYEDLTIVLRKELAKRLRDGWPYPGSDFMVITSAVTKWKHQGYY